MFIRSSAASLAGICLICTSVLPAQTVTSSIFGTVFDSSKHRVPKATVTVHQVETGLERITPSDDQGAYEIANLPIGTYTVDIGRDGFATARLETIRLSLDQSRKVDVTLWPAGPSARVDVSATGSEIDPISGSVGARLENRAIRDLPINGRNWANLLPLIPGATDPGSSDQRTVRFAGHGRDDNNITYDGVDATGISNQPQKTGIRLAVPTNAITEFKVDSATYPVDSADGTGGQVSLASPSGTNDFHGQVFEFLRNDVFDARNPTIATGKQPFRLNQFGANVGGPIVRNRTFFFAAFEAYRQRLDQPVVGLTASSGFKAQILSRYPALAPLVNSLPAGNLSQTDSRIDRIAGLSPQKVDETSGMIRLDHRFSSKVSSFLRVNVDEEVSDTPLNNLRDRTVVDNRPINGVASVTQVLSPTLLNETKAGFNQVFSRTNNLSPLPYTLAITGFTSVAGAQQRQEDDSSASLLDTISWTKGSHTFRAGAEGRRVFTNPGSSSSGTLTFTSVSGFAANQLDSVSITSLLPMKRLRKTQAFGFVQDEWKATPTLTFNLGLRYQFFNAFKEATGRAVPFDLFACGGFCESGIRFSNPRTNDLDPRIAFAWSPANLQNRTVLRGGFGIYHGDGQLEDQNLPASNDVPRYSLQSVSYPFDSLLANATGTLAPLAQNRNRKDEYSSQWSLAIQQELPAQVTGTASYTGNKGSDLQTITALNVLDPITRRRPFPNFSQVQYRTNDSNSTFHALILSARRPLRAGWLLGGNYMWSHAINDGSLGGGEADIVQPQNPFCRACDRASSAQDIRHMFSANSVYELPFGAGKPWLSHSGVARAVLGGWTLSGILTARSGVPVNVTVSRPTSQSPYGYNTNLRPNLVPGVSLTPSSGSSPSLWINPASFAAPAAQTFGNAGRDLVRGPKFGQLDLALARSVSITERLGLQFRCEAFNLFNRAQYGQPQAVLATSSFGQILSTINTSPVGTGTPRQIQFMIRASF